MTVISTLYVNFINGHHYFYTVTIVDHIDISSSSSLTQTNMFVYTIYYKHIYKQHGILFCMKIVLPLFNFI